MKETLKNKQFYNSLDVAYCKRRTLDAIISMMDVVNLTIITYAKSHENPKEPQSPTFRTLFIIN
jgi:hypothetical protein